MSRRKKKNDSLETLGLLVISIIELIIKIIVRIILFVYDLLTFFTSKYKEKSGLNFFKTYFDKGNYGEFVLYRKVIRVFGKESVLTNIYLDNRNTETTEIDVLAVSNKGIYVYEMKNYSGYIYGSEKDKHWTQVLNKWTKNKFYNPLKQNYAHTKAIETYLDVDSNCIVPIVVFSNRSKLSKINVGENHNVFQFRDALRFVKRNEKKGLLVITSEQKEAYLLKLLDKCHMSDEVKEKHIQDVVELQNNNNS
ncbi:MAG: nuclease-related domain-containing protein [Tenericutes bacterium]|nr:nuclease-related domain-containing protein [Mycoplasmatota bacterium]